MDAFKKTIHKREVKMCYFRQIKVSLEFPFFFFFLLHIVTVWTNFMTINLYIS